jgi:hypothetical protein
MIEIVETQPESPACSVDADGCRSQAQDAIGNIATGEIPCTASPSEKLEGMARWRAIFQHLKDHQLSTSEARFEFSHTKALKAELVELIKVEQICCAHISWSFEETPDQLILTLVADPSALRPIVNGFLPLSP